MSKSISTSATVLVLSSFALDSINEELVSRNLAPATEVASGATLLAMGCRTLDEVAATVVNLSKGTVTGEELGKAFEKAFPAHKIGARHGPHYLSLSRTGGLSGNVVVRYAPAKGARKAPAPAATFDLSGIDAKQLASMAKSAKGTALEAIISAELAKREVAAK